MKKAVSVISALLIAALSGGAEVFAYSDPYPVPKVDGLSQKDAMIAVAKSQIGYKDDAQGGSYFAVWAGEEPTAPWCSEFVSWCARTAGIPEDVIPSKKGSGGFRSFYSGTSYYLPANRQNHYECGCADHSVGYLTVSEIMPGDILLIETNKNFSDGSDHTALCLYTEGDTIYTIDGNWNEDVSYCTRKLDVVHGICRPNYDGQQSSSPWGKQSSEKKAKLSLLATAKGDVTVSWDKQDNVNGYAVYVRKDSEKKFRKVKTVSSSVNSTVIEGLDKGGVYFLTVRPYTSKNGKKSYGKYSEVSKVKIPKNENEVPAPANLTVKTYPLAFTIEVKWDRPINTAGYDVYEASSPNGEYRKMFSYEIDNPDCTELMSTMWWDEGDTHYIKIYHYGYINGKKVYSEASETVKVKF